MNGQAFHTYIEEAGQTDVGLRRSNNEDSVLMMPEQGCYVISDGMGGGAAGEVASWLVISKVKDALENSGVIPAERACALVKACYRSNELIHEYLEEKHYKTMGATVAGVLLDEWNPGRVSVFSAGDSHVYRLHGEDFELLTEDHTLAASQEMEEQELPASLRGILANVVGLGNGFYLDRKCVRMAEGDILLLCTDGLYRMVPEDEIYSILRRGSLEKAEVLCAQLVEDALQHGGRDNVSVVVLKIGTLPEAYAPSEEEQILAQNAEEELLLALSDAPLEEVLPPESWIAKGGR